MRRSGIQGVAEIIPVFKYRNVCVSRKDTIFGAINYLILIGRNAITTADQVELYATISSDTIATLCAMKYHSTICHPMRLHKVLKQKQKTSQSCHAPQRFSVDCQTGEAKPLDEQTPTTTAGQYVLVIPSNNTVLQ